MPETCLPPLIYAVQFKIRTTKLIRKFRDFLWQRRKDFLEGTWTWSILPFQQLYENSYSLHPINCMASTGNGRAPVRQTPEDQPTIVRFDEFFVWRKNLTNCKLEWQHSVFNYLRTFIYFFEDFYQYSLHIYFSIWFTQGWLNC